MIATIIIILLAGLIIWTTETPPHQTNSHDSSAHRVAPLPKEAAITLTKNGFSPNQITIKVGSAIRWENKSGSQETVNSDNYPTNQLHRELNFGVFSNNSSVVHTFAKPGTYGYHNQFHPQQHGKVIVVQ